MSLYGSLNRGRKEEDVEILGVGQEGGGLYKKYIEEVKNKKNI